MADSIANLVTEKAKVYRWYIQSYDAKAYIKGTTEVLKKNILLRYAPNIFTFDKRGRETILEALVDVHFKAPNYYTQNITAITGTRTNPGDIYERLLQFMNINVYNTVSFNNEIMMPFAPEASDNYRYFYEGAIDSLNLVFHKLRIEPKSESPKLISALVYILDGYWSIAALEAKGQSGFANFKLKMNMGTSMDEFLLPKQIEVFMEMKILGNHVINRYTSIYDYTSIVKYWNTGGVKKPAYDISDYFNTRTDSVPIIKDSVFWDKNRPLPLTETDRYIYRQEKSAMDSMAFNKLHSPSLKDESWRFTRMMINPMNFRYRETNFRYSGFLNPLKVGYSATDGFSYSQQLKLESSLGSGRSIGFYPDAGYVFGRKELFFRLPFEWTYAPERLGTFNFAVGNGNQGLNIRDILEVNEHLKDSAFKFEDYNLAYYKHYYTEIKNRVEVSNGLLLDLMMTYHYRIPVIDGSQTYKKDDGSEQHLPDTDVDGLDMNESYRSFVPYIALTWTPKLYYRMDRQRKHYVGSGWPTFSVKYARGIKHILRSDSDFERIEMDVQQRIRLKKSTSFHYYAGAGAFTGTKSQNFVDFHNFARRNFPESWDDKTGGVFHLLNDYWYYASNTYLQGHIMYESPFIFLRFIKKISRYVISERLYTGQLCLPGILPSYTELGYGIGNVLFNAGVFVNMQGLEFQKIGFKFAFEL
ncbi:MAG: DUF5686 family protein [Dysgonamonadaceae bacterium]|nr:DUF5686 family protein [Dysgonamonadaceae bacterium]